MRYAIEELKTEQGLLNADIIIDDWLVEDGVEGATLWYLDTSAPFYLIVDGDERDISAEDAERLIQRHAEWDEINDALHHWLL